jgi:hypothetical protein
MFYVSYSGRGFSGWVGTFRTLAKARKAIAKAIASGEYEDVRTFWIDQRKHVWAPYSHGEEYSAFVPIKMARLIATIRGAAALPQ